MKANKLLIAVTYQLISLISGGTESLPTTSAIPFQVISPAEFQAISELSDGKPFITQQRLLSSGSATITSLIKSIFTGLIRFVYITGLDSVLDSAVNPSPGGPTKGYPFCSIQANGNNKHIRVQRSLDGFDDPVSNLGTFPWHFFYPGIVKIENIHKDTKTEELRHFLKKDFHKFHKPSAMEYGPPPDANKDRHDNVPAPPVFNCIVVLKDSSDDTTTTPAPPPPPPPAPLAIAQPTYHQQPNSFAPDNTFGSYQVVALPYPPYLGLVGPASSRQAYPSNPSNPPSYVIPPVWPYWPMPNPSVVAQ